MLTSFPILVTKLSGRIFFLLRFITAADRALRSRYYKAGRYLLMAVCLTFLAGTAVLAWAFLASIRVM